MNMKAPSFWPYFHSVGGALHWYRRGHGIKPRTGLNPCSGLIFTTALVVFIYTKIIFMYNNNSNRSYVPKSPKIKVSSIYERDSVH